MTNLRTGAIDRPGDVRFVLVPGADHFDVIDPTHEAWIAAVAELA